MATAATAGMTITTATHVEGDPGDYIPGMTWVKLGESNPVDDMIVNSDGTFGHVTSGIDHINGGVRAHVDGVVDFAEDGIDAVGTFAQGLVDLGRVATVGVSILGPLAAVVESQNNTNFDQTQTMAPIGDGAVVYQVVDAPRYDVVVEPTCSRNDLGIDLDRHWATVNVNGKEISCDTGLPVGEVRPDYSTPTEETIFRTDSKDAGKFGLFLASVSPRLGRVCDDEGDCASTVSPIASANTKYESMRSIHAVADGVLPIEIHLFMDEDTGQADSVMVSPVTKSPDGMLSADSEGIARISLLEASVNPDGAIVLGGEVGEVRINVNDGTVEREIRTPEKVSVVEQIAGGIAEFLSQGPIKAEQLPTPTPAPTPEPLPTVEQSKMLEFVPDGVEGVKVIVCEGGQASTANGAKFYSDLLSGWISETPDYFRYLLGGKDGNGSFTPLSETPTLEQTLVWLRTHDYNLDYIPDSGYFLKMPVASGTTIDVNNDILKMADVHQNVKFDEIGLACFGHRDVNDPSSGLREFVTGLKTWGNPLIDFGFATNRMSYGFDANNRVVFAVGLYGESEAFSNPTTGSDNFENFIEVNAPGVPYIGGANGEMGPDYLDEVNAVLLSQALIWRNYDPKVEKCFNLSWGSCGDFFVNIQEHPSNEWVVQP